MNGEEFKAPEGSTKYTNLHVKNDIGAGLSLWPTKWGLLVDEVDRDPGQKDITVGDYLIEIGGETLAGLSPEKAQKVYANKCQHDARVAILTPSDKATVVKCAAGHPLMESSRAIRWFCNVCNAGSVKFTSEWRSPGKRMRCHMCDYDLCEACFADGAKEVNEARKKKDAEAQKAKEETALKAKQQEEAKKKKADEAAAKKKAEEEAEKKKKADELAKKKKELAAKKKVEADAKRKAEEEAEEAKRKAEEEEAKRKQEEEEKEAEKRRLEEMEAQRRAEEEARVAKEAADEALEKAAQEQEAIKAREIAEIQAKALQAKAEREAKKKQEEESFSGKFMCCRAKTEPDALDPPMALTDKSDVL